MQTLRRHRLVQVVAMVFRIAAVFAAATLSLASSKQTPSAPHPDPTFNAPAFVAPSPASYTLLLANGKFLRFGNTHTLVELPTGPLTRHFADGSVDPSFRFSSGYNWVGAVLELPDGKLIVAAARTAYSAVTTEELLRLNAEGTMDPSFQPVFVTPAAGYARGLVLQPDGKVLVAGPFTEFGGQQLRGIVRLLPDGNLDGAFAAVELWLNASGFTPGFLASNNPVLQPDGKIIIYGNFRRAGGTNTPAGVARLNSNGTVDATFLPSGFSRVAIPRAAVLQPDGKVIIGGRFSVPASFGANPTGTTYTNLPFVRLNSNGAADQTYGYFNAAAQPFFIRDAVLQPDGKLIGTNTSLETPTLFRFDVNGSLDASFHRPVFQLPTGSSSFAQPFILQRQSDGRILASGLFADVDAAVTGTAHFGIARFDTDGNLDPSLTTAQRTGLIYWPAQVSTGASGATFISLRQSDIGGGGDTAVPNNLARLNANGSIDATYQPFANPDPNAALQRNFLADGFVRLAGDELFVFGTKRPSGEFQYGRLGSDGTQDPAMTIDPTLANVFRAGAVQARLHSASGILLSSGDAQSILYGSALKRILMNGAVDPSFQLPAEITNALVVRGFDNELLRIYADLRLLAVQPDSKIFFVYRNSESTARLIRLNPNGSLDGSFTPVELEPVNTSLLFPVLFDPLRGSSYQPLDGVVLGEAITECEIQNDGRVVIAGPFRSINSAPARGIARLNANGTVDQSFQTGQGPMWTSLAETPVARPVVEQVELDTGGKLVLSGTFESFNGIAAPGIVRLNADGSVDPSFGAPAVRQKQYKAGSALARQPDGSFLLSGPYTRPGDPLGHPTVIRIVSGPALLSAVSRKVHGGVAPFDINLPLSGSPAIECRSGGAGGNYTLVFTFDSALASGSAAVTSGAGSVSGAPTISGNTIAVELSGVTNAQTLTLTLQGVTDAGAQTLPDTPVTLRLLLGDTNGDGSVNAGDVLQTRNRSGQSTDATNFRSDVNADGFVNSGDTLSVRSRSGTSLP